MFALPGNPVSGIATFLTLAKPALQVMSGLHEAKLTLRARLTLSINKRHNRTEFMRANLRCGDDAILHVTPLQKQGSGMLRGVAEANALLVLPEAAQEYVAGTVVDVLPLPGWA
jgi:molybdopterin molybdotransferase